MARGQVLPQTFPYFKNTERRDGDDPWQHAYKTCLEYESRAKSPVDHVRARVLGYLAREAPYEESRDMICREINSCNGENAKLQELADLYVRSFFRVFRSSRRPTPSPSQHPSRPFFDTMRDSLKEDLQPTPRTTSRQQALKRDNNRCIVTGTYSAVLYRDAPNEDIRSSGQPIGLLQVAHILPRSINEGIAASESKRNEAAEVWTVMQRFGKISPQELNGDRVHRLENVMTLWDSVHSLFDQLMVWFEPTDDDPYTCLVKTSLAREGLHLLPESFTLATTDPNLPRPSPDYLRLHASCARVAHLSGAAEYVASMHRDIDGQGVLAEDGSSAMALHAMLSALVH